jgi:hypothetical protein
MTADPAYFATEADLRAWLAAYHPTAAEPLVGFWKKTSARRLATLIADSAAGRKIGGVDIRRKPD